MEHTFTDYGKPTGTDGEKLLDLMDEGHTPLSLWAMKNMKIEKDDKVLDIGCGSGLNIKRLHEKSPNSKTYGVDHSSTSVKKSRMMNRDEVEKGHIVIEEANVLDMPFENKTFDVITGFETVYFWPDIVNSFREVGRILKDEGIFFIILEANGCHNLDMEDQANDEGCTFYTDKELKKLLSDAGYSNLTFYLRNRQENTKLIRKITDDGCCEKIVEDKYDNDNYLEELESEDFKPSPQWMCIKAQK